MVNCRQNFFFIVSIFQRFGNLYDLIQHLMVTDCNAAIKNIICGMVTALLCVRAVANHPCIHVKHLLHIRKKSKGALLHTDFLGSRQ